MQIERDGHYLDGQSARRQLAKIRLTQTGLQIDIENGTTISWPYNEIRQTQGFYTGEQIRLERGEETPETLLISDTDFLTDLHRLSPDWSNRFHNPATRKIRLKLTVLAAIGAIGVSIILYLWGIPALAALLTPYVPVSWEEQLGKGVIAQLAPPEIQCTEPTRKEKIDQILTTLTDTLPSHPYSFQVYITNKRMLNAFAAPGGYIVIFRGVLDETNTPEELAGVLAHEVQHVLQRHTTRTLLQHASTGLLLAALTGDVGGAMAFGLESARTVEILRHSRRNEEEADREGMRMLVAAGIDPEGMVSFFELVKRKGMESPDFMKYLSTHPSTDDRIERLKQMAARSQRKPQKLLEGYDWSDIVNICEKHRAPKNRALPLGFIDRP